MPFCVALGSAFSCFMQIRDPRHPRLDSWLLLKMQLIGTAEFAGVHIAIWAVFCAVILAVEGRIDWDENLKCCLVGFLGSWAVFNTTASTVCGDAKEEMHRVETTVSDERTPLLSDEKRAYGGASC